MSTLNEEEQAMKVLTSEGTKSWIWVSYKKRPVIVKALRLHEDVMIQTREGALKGRSGDMLICGIEGEIYPCDPKIFEKTYELCAD